MGILETNGVDFAAFQMIGSAKKWWRDYLLTRPVGSSALTWDQFSHLLLEKFLHVTTQEEKRRQFEQLQQGSMIVTLYENHFVELSRHAILLLPTERERVRRFIEGLAQPIRLQMAKETGTEISFQDAANVARRVESVLGMGGQGSDKRPRHSSGFSSASSGGGASFSRGQSSRPFHSALQASHGTSGGRGSYMPPYSQPVYSAPSAPIREHPLQSYYRGQPARQGQSSYQEGCFECGEYGHIRRACPKLSGIISICDRAASVLFDPGTTYSYVSSYFASYLIVPRDSLSVPVYVSMPVGDAIMVDCVYRYCVVVIEGLETSVDLLLLDMVDFDVILGIDWLSPYYTILDCHAKTVTLALTGLPRLEWKGTPGHSPSRVISYAKARRMVEKGCLAYLAHIREFDAEVSSIDLVPIVREFPEDRINGFDPEPEKTFHRRLREARDTNNIQELIQFPVNMAEEQHMVVQEFMGLPHEDPQQHILNFLEISDNYITNGATSDYVRHTPFPFSLLGEAKRWLKEEPANFITSWNDLARKFLARFFPSGKTAKIRSEIVAFKQKIGNLYT
ncbi:uncharacterized protein [Nicotiana sylvestris]|uniref:uncharacterized protein n=1 Tax=Nicotiana sylvestris TaxID=4096 RepID=UPI00388C54B8